MTNEDDQDQPGPYVRWRIASALILVLVIVLGGVWAYVLIQPFSGIELSAETINAKIRSWGMWGILGAILLMILHSFIPFPAEIVAVANGMVYGPIWGTVITWTGAMLGAYLAFGLARALGRPFVLAVIADRHRMVVDRWVQRQGSGTLFFSRFIPIISFNLINYAAGLTNVSWWTFTWATGLGILPLTVLMVLFGDRMWSGEAEIWIWMFVAGIAGWLVWIAAMRYRQRGVR
ncbi:MAG: TVP38/TMEM64 family protein [Hyphomicrobiales bacterium]|nr:TVP38/TMEM64 family protein [Hyphomicrobiales bacterium]